MPSAGGGGQAVVGGVGQDGIGAGQVSIGAGQAGRGAVQVVKDQYGEAGGEVGGGLGQFSEEGVRDVGQYAGRERGEYTGRDFQNLPFPGKQPVETGRDYK